jgi:hypothetical protein
LRFIGIPNNAAGSTTSLEIDTANNNEIVIGTSSRRFKDNIADMSADSADKLQELRPVSFTYKKDENSNVQFGLIAEEVAEIYPELVPLDQDGKPFSVKYDKITPLLVKYIQIQQAKIADLEQDNAEHVEKNASQDERITAQDERIKECLSRLAAIEA